MTKKVCRGQKLKDFILQIFLFLTGGLLQSTFWTPGGNNCQDLFFGSLTQQFAQVMSLSAYRRVEETYLQIYEESHTGELTLSEKESKG